ncbi:hypothetical protein OG883_07165 [Streptomyces sp. NBC_01142]|uniref:hypothetical protein n=1 Tax=Streptomyces sp. NBC_01142 TaxID=2975865 RepID=UPI00224E329D|nr:hypothetical protein [Streptomyces sp. NBC_01142]MCX4819685.1 hypothetical protein [Streptomyces sp. NBC_01142]
MNRRRCLALLTPPLAVSFALASAAGAQGMSQRAPESATVLPTPGCAVVRSTDAPGPAAFSLMGEGFPEGAKVSFLGPSHAGTNLTVDADGAFVVPGAKDAQYHIVVDDGEDTVKCAKAKGPQAQKDEERAAGFTAGHKAVKANCQATQPQGIAPRTKSYDDGWKEGAAAAAAKFC